MLFYFPPADIVSQILNFGLPAPIDIQIVGRDVEANHEFANNLMKQLSSVTGIADLRIQQPFNQPKLHINVDRTKTLAGGLHAEGCCRQPAGFVERQLSDFAVLLARSQVRGQLHRRDAGPAVRFRVLAGSRKYSCDWSWRQRPPARPGSCLRTWEPSREAREWRRYPTMTRRP